MPFTMPNAEKMVALRRGVVIPALPLALADDGKFSEKHQRALFHYYGAAGAGGVAVGVHTTQFEIRQPQHGLFRPVLELSADMFAKLEKLHRRPFLRVAGICGPTLQATAEAELAASLKYDIALLSLAALKEASDEELLAHCREVAAVMPVMGFYLQPAAGGRLLSADFWRRFFEIENVIAVKIAPFNRYQTIDVIRGLALAGRENDVTLYTGNDDNIIADLLTPFPVVTPRGKVILRIQGGLLGQWAVWTQKAVQLLNETHAALKDGKSIPLDLLRKNAALTDANAAVFDVANKFAGCIAGINEILRRQGLLPSARCLSTHEKLSPGQAEQLDRVCRDYPWLIDDDFVREHLAEWLAAS